MELAELCWAGVETFNGMGSTSAGFEAVVGAAFFSSGIDVFGFADVVLVEAD